MAERTVDLGIKGLVDAVEIGRGGFAVVFRAFQPAFDRFVAVKLFGDLALDQSTEASFERECQAIGRISDRANILTVYYADFTAAGRPYLVMAFMARGSLEDRLRREGRLPWPEALAIGVKLARALQVAHDAGVLHRDVKPDNVLVSDDDEPLLADFGIARLTDQTRKTRTGPAFTPAYAAPEVLADEAPTVAVDIYSLAATVFTMMLGRPAFVERADDGVLLIMRRVVEAPIPDLLRPLGIPEVVCQAIETAMAKDPADRPPSAAAFAARLEAAERETLAYSRLSRSAPTAVGAVTPASFSPPGSPSGQPEPPVSQPGRRSFWKTGPGTLVLVGLLSAVAAFGGALAIRNNGGSPTPSISVPPVSLSTPPSSAAVLTAGALDAVLLTVSDLPPGWTAVTPGIEIWPCNQTPVPARAVTTGGAAFVDSRDGVVTSQAYTRLDGYSTESDAIAAMSSIRSNAASCATDTFPEPGGGASFQFGPAAGPTVGDEAIGLLIHETFASAGTQPNDALVSFIRWGRTILVVQNGSSGVFSSLDGLEQFTLTLQAMAKIQTLPK